MGQRTDRTLHLLLTAKFTIANEHLARAGTDRQNLVRELHKLDNHTRVFSNIFNCSTLPTQSEIQLNFFNAKRLGSTVFSLFVSLLTAHQNVLI